MSLTTIIIIVVVAAWVYYCLASCGIFTKEGLKDIHKLLKAALVAFGIGIALSILIYIIMALRIY